MAKCRLYPHVYIKDRPRSFVVYGKEFVFDPGKTGSREAALLAAESHGAAMLKTFETQVGRPLSTREQMTLKVDAPPEKKPAKPVVDQQPVNPYDARLATLRKKGVHTRSEKLAHERHIQRFEELQAAWNERHAQDGEIAARLAAREADSEFARMRKAAVDHLASVRSDPKASVADLARAERLLKLANSNDCTPGQYWQEVGALPPGAPDLFDGGSDATQ